VRQSVVRAEHHLALVSVERALDVGDVALHVGLAGALGRLGAVGHEKERKTKEVDRKAEPDDMEQFQTIYAKNEGAVTAPSTGLHFSRELMKMMEIRGYQFAYITVHCSLGSFDPIEVEDLTKHKMNSEQMIISDEACKMVNEAKQAGHKICAVGISTMRATESAVGTDGMLKEFEGWTNKFIFPPYEFGLANSIITNFYHPESTMMMATAAFAGYELTIEAYKLALKHKFMFGCYGDAMLVVDD
jgi:S-adenosylmethionine:tRNA ribosyltransferase-isomerase